MAKFNIIIPQITGALPWLRTGVETVAVEKATGA